MSVNIFVKLKVRSTKTKCEQQIMEREMTERKGNEEKKREQCKETQVNISGAATNDYFYYRLICRLYSESFGG